MKSDQNKLGAYRVCDHNIVRTFSHYCKKTNHSNVDDCCAHIKEKSTKVPKTILKHTLLIFKASFFLRVGFISVLHLQVYWLQMNPKNYLGLRKFIRWLLIPFLSFLKNIFPINCTILVIGKKKIFSSVDKPDLWFPRKKKIHSQ